MKIKSEKSGLIVSKDITIFGFKNQSAPYPNPESNPTPPKPDPGPQPRPAPKAVPPTPGPQPQPEPIPPTQNPQPQPMPEPEPMPEIDYEKLKTEFDEKVTYKGTISNNNYDPRNLVFDPKIEQKYEISIEQKITGENVIFIEFRFNPKTNGSTPITLYFEFELNKENPKGKLLDKDRTESLKKQIMYMTEFKDKITYNGIINKQNSYDPSKLEYDSTITKSYEFKILGNTGNKKPNSIIVELVVKSLETKMELITFYLEFKENETNPIATFSNKATFDRFKK
ncbi:proline-rich putative variable surface lipoprotein [[Mycoplasma] phocae]|uniref:Proline-rich putative variable surface lipoprotein n=1 Tax=[Mycoplasma] phocae TaxID=142651 RepID=A0A2Z5IQ23_9BACT|nr:hypothetical protein [[Mycoplasma] phocae]AXE60799.1 proline-rich putative variable surface lipoprotein [[Mycoplasma] phocae]